jgi:hypothetical protein
MKTAKNDMSAVYLKNVIDAIAEWKNGCDERGETPVCIANFASAKSTEKSDDGAECVLVGEPDDLISLLGYTNKLVRDAVAEEMR